LVPLTRTSPSFFGSLYTKPGKNPKKLSEILALTPAQETSVRLPPQEPKDAQLPDREALSRAKIR